MTLNRREAEMGFGDEIPKRGMGCNPNVAPVTPNREAIQEARIRERSVSDSD